MHAARRGRPGGSPTALQRQYRADADRIIQAALADSAAYQRLAYLVDTYGSRISGSESLERAIDWIQAEMKRDGLQNVRTQPVMVPHWVRGAESVELLEPRALKLPMLGLGEVSGRRRKASPRRCWS